MNNKVFGEVTFSYGWEKKETMPWNDTEENISVSVTSYDENSPITSEQESSYIYFKDNKTEILEKVLSLMQKYKCLKSEHKPSLLKIEEDGGMALFLDNLTDDDLSIAVIIKPEYELVMAEQIM